MHSLFDNGYSALYLRAHLHGISLFPSSFLMSGVFPIYEQEIYLYILIMTMIFCK